MQGALMSLQTKLVSIKIEKKYKFSNPYTYSSAVLVVRDNEKNIKSFNDVKR